MAVVPVIGGSVTFSPNGSTKQFILFVPFDWNVNDRWSLFHAGWYGDGETTASSLKNNVPYKLINNGWDGKVHLNNGNIAKFALLCIPNNGYLGGATDYKDAMNECVAALGMDKVLHKERFSTSGFSGGPARMWQTLRYHNSTAYMFQRTISMSSAYINETGGVPITNLTGDGFHQVWHSKLDSNTGTKPGYSIYIYNYLKGKRRRIHWTSHSGHNYTHWDEMMNIRGVNTPTGGNAYSQDGGRWRWLADPYDGIAPPLQFEMSSSIV